ncbi:MAG: hypothetical protein Q4Q03_02350, partial [Bowdeniella nasicola]|nr:hypothetical protein [Bowdeniella nasicola]
PHRFTQDFLQRLRDLVVLAIAGQDGRDAIHGVPVDELDAMVDQAKQLGARRASASADAVHDALAEMTGATSPRLQLELLCARLILIQETADQPRPPAQAPAATTAQVAQGSASKRPPLPTFGKAKEDPPTRKDPSPTARPEADPTSAPVSPTGTPRVPLPGQRPDTGMAPAESVAEAPPTSTSSMPPAERHGDVEDTENERTSAPAVAASSQDVGAGDEVRAGDESTAMSDPKEHREPSSADADMLRRRWNEVLGVLENLSRVTWTQVRDTASVGPLRDQELLILFRHRGVLMRFNQGNNQQILAHAIYQALGLQLRVRGVDAAQYDATGGERDPKAEGEAQRQNSSQHHETNPSARAASADEHTGGQREEEVHKARPTADGIPADGEVVTNEDASAAPPTVPIPQVPLPGASETPVPPTPRFGDRQYNLAEDHHSLAHPPAVESVRTEPSEEQEREGPPDDSGGASSDDEVVENVPQQVDGVKLLQQHLGGIVIEEIDEP